MNHEALDARALLLGGARACRVCGCTQANACMTPEHGPCWWIEADLCSHCGEPAIVAWQLAQAIAAGRPELCVILAPRALAALQRASVTPLEAFEL